MCQFSINRRTLLELCDRGVSPDSGGCTGTLTLNFLNNVALT